jgi:hypothetical protein
VAVDLSGSGLKKPQVLACEFFAGLLVFNNIAVYSQTQLISFVFSNLVALPGKFRFN